MKKILIGVIAYCIFSSLQAGEIEDRNKILGMMKSYAGLVACMTSFEKDPENGRPTTLNDIYTLDYNNTDNSYVFYVLWAGDMGCLGGSGTMSSYVTEVARYGGEWKPYTVQNDYAFGENVGLNYKYIESIKKINSSHFEVVSWDYADAKFGGVDGGSNFPANKFKYTLEQNEFEPWKITRKVLLEQKQ